MSFAVRGVYLALALVLVVSSRRCSGYLLPPCDEDDNQSLLSPELDISDYYDVSASEGNSGYVPEHRLVSLMTSPEYIPLEQQNLVAPIQVLSPTYAPPAPATPTPTMLNPLLKLLNQALPQRISQSVSPMCISSIQQNVETPRQVQHAVYASVQPAPTQTITPTYLPSPPQIVETPRQVQHAVYTSVQSAPSQVITPTYLPSSPQIVETPRVVQRTVYASAQPAPTQTITPTYLPSPPQIVETPRQVQHAVYTSSVQSAPSQVITPTYLPSSPKIVETPRQVQPTICAAQASPQSDSPQAPLYYSVSSSRPETPSPIPSAGWVSTSQGTYQPATSSAALKTNKCLCSLS